MAKVIDKYNPLATAMYAAFYFDKDVVGDDWLKDLTGNGFRFVPTTALEDFQDAGSTISGDNASHQGYTTDGTSHFTTDTAALYLYPDDATWTTVPVASVTNATPHASLEAGTDHLGGCQYIADTNQICVAAIDNPGAAAEDYTAQLAFYNSTTLAYEKHVKITTEGNEFDAAGVAYDGVNYYVCSFYESQDKIYVFRKSEIDAASSGDTVSTSKVITLNYPAYQAQGIHYKDSELWIMLNEFSVYVYGMDGAIKRSYYLNPANLGAYSGGGQDLDYSQSELRCHFSNNTSQGIVAYFDLTSVPALSATHDGGLRVEYPQSYRINFNSNIGNGFLWPEVGTIVARVKVRAMPDTVNSMHDHRAGSTTWRVWFQDSGFPVKFSANQHTTTIGSGAPFLDGLAQNTWINVAFRWHRNRGGTAYNDVYVDGTSYGQTSNTWQTAPVDLGLGPTNRYKTQSGSGVTPDFDVQSWYFYKAYKDDDELDRIFADLTGMIIDEDAASRHGELTYS